MIAYPDGQAPVLAPGFHPHGAALRRILDGVVQKIPQRAGEGLAIGGDHGRSVRLIQFHQETAAGDFAPELLDDGPDQFARIQRFQAIG